MFQYVEVKRLVSNARVPTRNGDTDAGLDLYALDECTISPGDKAVISTGIALAIPEGYVGLIWDRSSMGNKNIHTVGGVIDCSYRGEIRVLLFNLGHTQYYVDAGHKIAQLLIQPVVCCTPVEVAELSATVRGTNGFGSSGV